MLKRIFFNVRLITPERVIDNAYVVVEGKKIAGLGVGPCPEVECEKIDGGGNYLSPGFIDIHCHGGGGHDFMDGSKEAFIGAAKAHASFGTTSLLPTSLACSNEELKDFLEIFDTVKGTSGGGANLIGLHLEAPYFSQNQRGAQDPRYIRNPQKEDYEEIYRWGKGNILRWSAAPELPGAAEFGRFLMEKGILASIAHSDATYEDVITAYENGFNFITHLYSGMSTITREKGYRKLGVLESAFVIEGMGVELIADGHHLPKELIRFVYKLKGAENIALVTDAMRAAGMGDGESIMGSLKDGQKVVVEGGVAKLLDYSAFAGSVCTTDRLVRTATKLAGIPICDAIKMTTSTPAKKIGIDKYKGSIAVGKDADLVLFNEDIEILKTMVEGNMVIDRN